MQESLVKAKLGPKEDIVDPPKSKNNIEGSKGIHSILVAKVRQLFKFASLANFYPRTGLSNYHHDLLAI